MKQLLLLLNLPIFLLFSLGCANFSGKIGKSEPEPLLPILRLKAHPRSGSVDDILKGGGVVASKEDYTIVAAGNGGTASNLLSGVAVAGEGGIAKNHQYGVAATPLGGTAKGGAYSTAVSRKGKATSGSLGVAFVRGYNSEASIPQGTGVAYSWTPKIPLPGDPNAVPGKVSGKGGSILVLGALVKTGKDPERLVLESVKVGTWNWKHCIFIKPGEFYMLNERGRIVKAP